MAQELFAIHYPGLTPEMTYAHELGNLLDIRLRPELVNHAYVLHHGDPNDPWDTDTGMQLENCIFGKGKYRAK
jgi:hypothetical protein